MSTSTEGVIAIFTDGSTFTGTHLAGCDGSQSVVRRLLCPKAHALRPLPVALGGISLPYDDSFIKPIRDLDPYFFMASDPQTDAFLYFSFLDTPTNNTRTGPLKNTYECQMMVSWPLRPGFLGHEKPLEMPENNSERLQLLKEISKGWAEPFRTAIQAVPEGTRTQQVRVEDWVPGGWDSAGGRVIMLGDSAHPMTMYRGEAGNHGIADVKTFLDLYLPLWRDANSTNDDFKAAGDAYANEMLPRARAAVLNSRQACLDAHDSKRINATSPLLLRKPIDRSE